MSATAGRRFLSASASTILANGFMFLLTLLLVRSFEPAEFGLYALITTLVTLANMVIGALVVQQMGFSLARTPEGPLRISAGKMYASVAAICTGLSVPVVLAILDYTGSGLSVLAGGAAYVATSIFRAFTRHHFFSVHLPGAAVRQDFVFVLLATTLLAATAAGGGLSGQLGLILAALTAANVIATVLLHPPLPALWPRTVKRHFGAYRRHFLRASWSLATVMLSSLSLLSPNLILLARGSLNGLAIVAAPSALLAPLRLVTVIFQTTLRSEFSQLVHHHRGPELRRLYLLTTAAGVVLGTALLAGAYFGWRFIYTTVFARSYAQDTIWQATVLSILATSVTTIRFPGAMLLNAHNRFAVSATAWLIINPVVFALAVLFCARDDFASMLYAPLFGEIAIAAVEVYSVFRLISANSHTTKSV